MSDEPTSDVIPDPDPERTARVERMSAAIMLALLTANPQPYPMPAPAVVKMAELMDDHGWRQTETPVVDSTVEPWLKERMREEAQPVPVEADHFGVQETELVAEAPKQPSRIAKKYTGVVEQ